MGVQATGQAQKAYAAMPTDKATDYETVKKNDFDTIRYHERKLPTSIPNGNTKNGREQSRTGYSTQWPGEQMAAGM